MTQTNTHACTHAAETHTHTCHAPDTRETNMRTRIAPGNETKRESRRRRDARIARHNDFPGARRNLLLRHNWADSAQTSPATVRTRCAR